VAALAPPLRIAAFQYQACRSASEDVSRSANSDPRLRASPITADNSRLVNLTYTLKDTGDVFPSHNASLLFF